MAAGLLAVACAKENNINTDNESIDNPKIIGIIDDEVLVDPNAVKTTYDGSGNFSWVKDNCITVQLIGKDGTDKAGKHDKWTFKADNTASETTFTADGSSYTGKWDIGDYAFYPKNLATDEKPFDLVYNNDNPITVTLPAETGDYLVSSNYMSMIPLIGTKTGENTFNFSTATGILKLNFSGVPNVGGLRLELSHPSYPLCGKFSVSEQNTILASNYVSGAATRQLRPAGGFSTVYVALPIGTISAGLDIKLYKTSGEVYTHIVTSTPIEIKRNTLTELTTAIGAVTSAINISGTADAPQVTLSVGEGEAIAFAVGSTEDAALSNLSGTTWLTTAGTYDITGPTGKNYIAYKVKKNNHVYVKHAQVFYFITAVDAAAIAGEFNFNVAQYLPKYDSGVWHYIGKSTNVTYSGRGDELFNDATAKNFTLQISDDATKGSVKVTNILGLGTDGNVAAGSFINASHTLVNPSTMLNTATYGAGTGVYGYLTGSSLIFNNLNSQVFATYTYDSTTSNVYLRQTASAQTGYTFAVNNNGTTITLSANTELCLPISSTTSETGWPVGSCLIKARDEGNNSTVTLSKSL